jgi:pimeloyl-ACP methyl ester carboxylesterase
MPASPRAPAEAGRQVDANGASLYVEEHGHGVPLVLAHMGLASSATWAQLVPLLAEHARVITVDTRGHRRSTNPSGALTFELIADDLAALVAALGLKQPFVGGWSDGGEAALHVALRHPDRVRGVIAGGTSLAFGSAATRANARAFFHVDADGVADLDAFAAEHANTLLPALRRWHPGDEQQWQAVVQRSAQLWTTYPGLAPAQLARSSAPTLVALGDRDEHYTVEDAAALWHALPNAELAILPGHDHTRPVFEPATLAAVLLDFLRRH